MESTRDANVEELGFECSPRPNGLYDRLQNILNGILVSEYVLVHIWFQRSKLRI